MKLIEITVLTSKKIGSILGMYIMTVCMLLISCTQGEKRKKNSDSRPPNIVLILADDLGYGDLSCYGNDAYKTPNLDQLAKEGVRFTDFYATPLCTPTRAALLTGCYPVRVGLPIVIGPEGPEWTAERKNLGLHPQEETIAELLKEAGYATACIGKWHLGHHEEHLPPNQGFDYFFGFPYSNDMWPENNPLWAPLPLVEGTKAIDTIRKDQSHITKLFTDKALDFISAKKDTSFFLYLPYSMPHVPLFASKEYKNSSGKNPYADVIQEIDGSVGKVVLHLEALELTGNTLVVFLSDNGPWLLFGEHAGSSGGLREGKNTVFEGGVRVPFIAKWPDRIPKGIVQYEMTGIVDLLPTIAKIGNAPMPQKRIDGKDIMALLEGQAVKTARPEQFFWKDDKLVSIRKDNWKLVFPHEYQKVVRPGTAGNRGEQVPVLQGLALYDLDKDLGEEQDVSNKFPDIVDDLIEIASTHKEDIGKSKRPPGKSTTSFK